jgi:hypothetical protein
MTIGASALGADAVGAGPAGQEVIYGLISAPSSLGAPAILARNGALIEGLISAPSPLGTVRMVAINDFTDLLDPHQPDRYVMDLLVDGARVRAPISSWQATIQDGRANFVQCVVPAATPYMSAINAATSVVVSRRSQTRAGEWIEYEMARAPVQTTSYDRGPYRGTATISGYTAAVELSEAEPPARYDRALPGVRSISVGGGGVRARCAIDWLLRPGHRASADGETFVVSYINYYVNANDSYCDVGERV